MYTFTLYYKCLNCGLLVRIEKTRFAKKYHKNVDSAIWSCFNCAKGKVEIHDCGTGNVKGLVILTGVQQGEDTDGNDGKEK